jgi:hypothetical protein
MVERIFNSNRYLSAASGSAAPLRSTRPDPHIPYAPIMHSVQSYHIILTVPDSNANPCESVPDRFPRALDTRLM